MPKIICPFHDDHTESMEVYQTGDCYTGHCFVCNSRQRFDKLPEGIENARQIKKEPTDVKAELARLLNLPIKRIRGLEFHSDGQSSFYIVWPDKTYYKRRNSQGTVRYVGPKGMKPPVFLYPGSKNHIICIEGEINCMSVKYIYSGPETLCSPGAATNFPKFIDLYKQYKRVTLILDKDAVGVAYGAETKEKLLKLGKRVNLVFVDLDFNDILVQYGPEALIKTFKELL